MVYVTGFHSLDALLAWGFELFAHNIRYGVVLLGDYLRAHHSVRGCPFWRMMLLQVWFTTWFWRSNGGYALDTLSLWAVLRASAHPRRPLVLFYRIAFLPATVVLVPASIY